MKPVQRTELLDYVTYNEKRDSLRSEALAAKAPRRVGVGEYLVFLFENQDTVRYQVQEMMRVERIVKESDIEHELETYNELLGGPGELGCTLLIGIDDEAERDEKLSAWLDLPAHLYAKLPDGTRVRPTFDPRQVGDTRLSSVQYLKFDVGGVTPVALGADLPALSVEVELDEAQRAALEADLASE
ncbi:MAG: DUF3501 family protein [Nannocystaceae bacterium]|nr:DUF3501 family protein [bacterium]